MLRPQPGNPIDRRDVYRMVARIAAQGAPADVARTLVPEVRVRVTLAPRAVLDEQGIAALDDVRRVTRVDNGATVELTTRRAIPAVVRAIAGMPGDLLGVAEEPPTLEEERGRADTPKPRSARDHERSPRYQAFG